MINTFYTVLTVLAVILTFTFIFLWSRYNMFIVKRNQVKTDYSDTDIQIKRRASLIEQLARMVAEYAKHEEDTFENVAKARSALDTSQTVQDTMKAENMFSQTLRSLFSVVEQYPVLKADANYKQLMDSLKQTEDSIAHYREQYNESVRKYNNTIQTFPNLIATAVFRFDEQPLFQIQDTINA